jgi:hypothetical protein
MLGSYTANHIITATAFLVQVIDIVDRNVANQDAGVGRKISGVYTYDEKYTSEGMFIDLIIPDDYGDDAFMDDFEEEGIDAVCWNDVGKEIIHIRITKPWE